VASVQFKLNGINVGPTVTTAPYTYKLDTKNFDNGVYELSVLASDAVGNTSLARSVTVEIKNKARI